MVRRSQNLGFELRLFEALVSLILVDLQELGRILIAIHSHCVLLCVLHIPLMTKFHRGGEAFRGCPRGGHLGGLARA